MRARFSYRPDGARYRRVDSGTLAGGTTTTTTIGLVERRELPGNVIEWRRRIGSIAIVEYHQEYVVAGITQVGVAGGTRHQFNDRLGTPQVIASVGASGASVTVHERLDTAADGEWRSPDPPFGQPGGSQRTSRGFTGHEHLEGHGVIHMTWIAGAIPNDRRSARRARAMDGPSSGRLYWQSGGRMVQADPIVTEPLNPQSWNPYSYVLNNPLNLTDPSGYSFIGKYWRTIASIAISIYAPYAAPWLGLTSAQAAIAGGFVAGAVQTNSLKGGVYGAFSAGMFNKIGTAFQGMSTTAGAAGTVGQTGLTAGQFTAKVVAHGMAGGVMSSLQGGKFGHGFASAGFSEAASPIVTVRGGTISQGTAVAVIGGTASAMTGGKFANGAVTAAFGYAFGRVIQRSVPVTASGSGASESVIVPPEIQLEASGYLTPEEAALAAGARYGAEGVANRQEVQLGLVQVATKNWGYLTPGWGPVGATLVDASALFDAYGTAGFAVSAWMHGHFDSQLNFSAQDFKLVWNKPKISTYMVNRNGEVRVLRHSHLKSALKTMSGSLYKKNLTGLQAHYETTGLPGDRL